ncbi:4-hydroxyphenylacetate 3-monooxygenase, oxygenase component [Bacillus sp. FJAT-42376]|uniref:4-hydroxyphenylacetate 3-monooxygenase, oxygenase component n=1 Tax=Bacillus sp. FJAT-42376 TaxID=2014076 RepID=UPI000F4E2BAA|nr:4-hydroxyphenylacetate 3-monooxygenase, oxygenase component [Bacillus sp. FJAT-42376]AZB44240.1 4-hydroxyphenylacetate 3-monooxygenase, oxygenase component [Bacillus sp. FJAT-42376]
MPVITGKQYIDRLNQLHPAIWYKGEKMKSPVSEHPAYKGAIRTKAELYDLQHQPDLTDRMTYTCPDTKEKTGMSYLTPKTKEDLIRRRLMMTEWARKTHGMMGRTPDYMNTAVMALTASSSILKDQDEEFSQNLIRHYNRAKQEDLSFTHSFINPQMNRASSYYDSNHQPVAAKVVKKTSSGLVIKGARLLATEGGMTDEVLVFPSGGGAQSKEFAFSFSIPSNTKGLSFLCRESFSQGESSFNYPLSSRFEEMDTVIMFDNVLVPWDRVFFYHRPDLAGKMFSESSFAPQALHQVINRQLVKLEFLLGLAQLLVSTLNVSEYQHIQEKIADLIIGVEVLEALHRKSENTAELDRWGTMCPNLQPLYAAICLHSKLYPRFIEILQLIGAGGFMTIASEEDFHSEIGEQAEHYLQGTAVDGKMKTALFRLAWDATMSSFGGRQTQYERFFFGDPVRLKSNLYSFYPRQHMMDEVLNFLDYRN